MKLLNISIGESNAPMRMVKVFNLILKICVMGFININSMLV